ncbi:MAG: hypothetical protein QF902_11050 [Rhodospirillales bacterium]|nr:hypothetical protein [Rhodospirillales bacterium]
MRDGTLRRFDLLRATERKAETERNDHDLIGIAAKTGQPGATLSAKDQAALRPTGVAAWHARHTKALAGRTPAFNAAADDALNDMIMHEPEKFAAMSLPSYFAEHDMTAGQRNAFIATQAVLRRGDPGALARLRRKTAAYATGYAIMRHAAKAAGIDWWALPGSAAYTRVLGLKTAVRDFVDDQAQTSVPSKPAAFAHQQPMLIMAASGRRGMSTRPASRCSAPRRV